MHCFTKISRFSHNIDISDKELQQKATYNGIRSGDFWIVNPRLNLLRL